MSEEVKEAKPRKSFGEKLKTKKLGLPVWMWALDLLVLIAFTKWIGVVITIQVSCLLIAFIYKKLGESKSKRPVIARVLLTVILMLIPGFFLSAILYVAYQEATMTAEERAEQNKIVFLGVELGASIDSGRYKEHPRQYVSDGDGRYYIIQIPLAKKLLPLEGFDVVKVYASAKSRTIYKIELKYNEAVYTDFNEHCKVVAQMMKSKFGIGPRDESDRHVSFRLKGGMVDFRTGGRHYISNGEFHEVGPYSTTLSCYTDDLSDLADKEKKEVLAEESKQKAKESADRVNKAASAGVDLL